MSDILILTHTDHCTPGHLAQVLLAQQLDYQVLRVDRGELAGVDLDRPKAGAHMAFGSGTHHCLGAPLARRELYWVFRAFIDFVSVVTILLARSRSNLLPLLSWNWHGFTLMTFLGQCQQKYAECETINF